MKCWAKGKIALKLLAPKSARFEVLAMLPCPPIYDIIDYHYYCIYAGEVTEDEPVDPCDLESNWVRGAPIYGWVYPEGSCNDGTDNGDACASLTQEQCACLMYGLGCEGGGTGEGIWEDYDSVLLDMNNPCIDSIFKRMNRIQGGSRSSLIYWVNQTFGQSVILNLRIMDGQNFSDSTKYAD